MSVADAVTEAVGTIRSGVEEWGPRDFIGASEVGAIMGLSRWRTPLDVWQEKRGEKPRGKAGEAAWWGTVLEPIVIAKLEADHGGEVTDRQAEFVDPDRPWLLCHVDGIWQRPDRADAVVEAKTGNALADGWTVDGDDDVAVPVNYRAQAYTQAHLTGLATVVVPVLLGGQRFFVRELEADPDDMVPILEMLDEFHDSLHRSKPPRWVLTADADAPRRFWPADRGSIRILPVEAAEHVAAYRQARADEKAAKQRMAAAATELQVLMGADAEGWFPEDLNSKGGKPAITWRSNAKPTGRLSSTALRAEVESIPSPQLRRLVAHLIDRATTETTPRPFRVN